MDENNDYEEDILPEPEENVPLKKKKTKNEKDIDEQQERFKAILNGLLADLDKSKEENNDSEEGNDDNPTGLNLLVAFKENWNSKQNKVKFRYRAILCFMFRALLPIFTIIHLIGIFQIMSIMNVLWDTIKNSFKCYLDLEDKEDKSSYEFYNFYSYYFKSSLDEGVEFDLMETMGFLGTIFLKYLGFGISTFTFLIINSISLFLIINFFNRYNSSNDKYTFLQIIYLCLCYFLLFIGVGASALLSQQILVDNWANYNSFIKENEEKSENDKKDEQKQKKDKENEEKSENDKKDEQKQKKDKENQVNEKEEEKQNTSSFFCICITIVIGFGGKYATYIIISHYKNNFDQQYIDIDQFNNTSINENITNINNIIFSHDKKLFYIIFVIYIVFTLLSILTHFLFELIFEENEISKESNYICDGANNCKIFGYNVYIKYIPELKSDDNKKKSKEINNNAGNDQKNEINNEENNENSPKEEDLHLTTISQKVVKGNNSKHDNDSNHNAKESVFLGCVNCYKCCNCLNCIKFFCVKFWFSLKLLSNSIKSCFTEIICKFCCCNQCPCCFCCECRRQHTPITEEDYNLNEEVFCYCYKRERNIKWFDGFIKDETQIKVMPLLLNFFILQLLTVAFQKMYNENNEDQNYEFILKNKTLFAIFFVGSFLFYLYLTYSFGDLLNTFLDKGIKGTIYDEMSSKILTGTFGIIIFCGLYSLIVSFLCFSKDIRNNNFYFVIPFLMNKFYSFTFAYHCAVFTDVDDDNIDLFSSSSLIAIYLSIWDFLVDLLSDYTPLNILLIIQIICSFAIALISLSLISMCLCFIGYFWLTFLYLISFFALGGCWFFSNLCQCHKRISELYKFECCKNHEKTCDNHKYLEKCFGKKKLLKLKTLLELEY